MLAILFRPCSMCVCSPRLLHYFVYTYYGSKRTWWLLFQKHTVSTKFDSKVFFNFFLKFCILLDFIYMYFINKTTSWKQSVFITVMPVLLHYTVEAVIEMIKISILFCNCQLSCQHIVTCCSVFSQNYTLPRV